MSLDVELDSEMTASSVDLKDLQKKYLIRRLKELSVIRSEVESGQFDKALTFSHQVSGNAEMYGFPELAGQAKKLKVFCTALDQSSAERILKIIEVSLEELSLQAF